MPYQRQVRMKCTFFWKREEKRDLLQNKNMVYLVLFEDFSAVQISAPEIKDSVNNVFSDKAEIFKMHRLKGETNGI